MWNGYNAVGAHLTTLKVYNYNIMRTHARREKLFPHIAT